MNKVFIVIVGVESMVLESVWGWDVFLWVVVVVSRVVFLYKE